MHEHTLWGCTKLVSGATGAAALTTIQEERSEQKARTVEY
jgi:hypothetical protein